MKGQIITVITTIFPIVSFAHAASQLSKEDAAAIEAAGLIIYPGSAYLDGNPDFDVKFATTDAPEKVQKWFQEKMRG